MAHVPYSECAVFIMTGVDHGLLSDSKAYELADDMHWSGYPYRTLEEAKQAAIDDLKERWEGMDGPVPALRWKIKRATKRNKVPQWSADCGELEVSYLIRGYVI